LGVLLPSFYKFESPEGRLVTNFPPTLEILYAKEFLTYPLPFSSIIALLFKNKDTVDRGSIHYISLQTEYLPIKRTRYCL